MDMDQEIRQKSICQPWKMNLESNEAQNGSKEEESLQFLCNCSNVKVAKHKQRRVVAESMECKQRNKNETLCVH